VTTVLVLVLLLALTGAGGLYAYALNLRNEGREALKNGQPDEAQTKLTRCLRVWPFFSASQAASIHLQVARAARLRGDFQEAEAHLIRCKKLQGTASDAVKLEFLLMRVQRGEVDEVVPELMRCVEAKHEESVLILETLSQSFMRNLRYGEALHCLTRWTKEQPDSADPFHWRGWVLERLSETHKALADYRRALELDPDRVPVRLRLAEVLLEKHKPLEALPHLERLRKQCPDNPEVLARLGECRFLQGQTQEARRLLEAAAKRRPKDGSLLNHLARLELQEERPERAEKWLRQALAADPNDAAAQFTLISSLRLQGRRKEADAAQVRYDALQTLLKRANQLLQDEVFRPTADARSACEIGTAMLQIGQDHVALYWLHEALRRQRRYPPACRALAKYHQKKGDTDQAAFYRRQLGEPAPRSGRRSGPSEAVADPNRLPPN
jgi:tetratricopeptide (TPR) repeat protein